MASKAEPYTLLGNRIDSIFSASKFVFACRENGTIAKKWIFGWPLGKYLSSGEQYLIPQILQSGIVSSFFKVIMRKILNFLVLCWLQPIWAANNPSPDCRGVKGVSLRCSSNEVPYRRDIFYVGGRYIKTQFGNVTVDQVYVEKLSPISGTTKPNPLVFFHGGGMSGTTWLNTPDNRLV